MAVAGPTPFNRFTANLKTRPVRGPFACPSSRQHLRELASDMRSKPSSFPCQAQRKIAIGLVPETQIRSLAFSRRCASRAWPPGILHAKEISIQDYQTPFLRRAPEQQERRVLPPSDYRLLLDSDVWVTVDDLFDALTRIDSFSFGDPFVSCPTRISLETATSVTLKPDRRTNEDPCAWSMRMSRRARCGRPVSRFICGQLRISDASWSTTRVSCETPLCGLRQHLVRPARSRPRRKYPQTRNNSHTLMLNVPRRLETTARRS